MFTFTDEQKRVIYEKTKNQLLLARAGAGKTFTVAHKIAESIKSGILPSEVLCLTFTVKGAEEIKADVEKYCNQLGVNVFTIHSFCYFIIKEYAIQSRAFSEPSVADEIDSGEIMANILKDFAKDGEYELVDELPLLPERQLAKIMSEIKHQRDLLGFKYSSEDGYGQAVKKLFNESSAFLSLFSTKRSTVKITDYSLINLLKNKGNAFALAYQRTLRASHLADFDDLIFLAKQLIMDGLYKKPAYKLIIVDEMQDTSMLEYQIARSFFGSAQVLMCGDPYQTIYSWRGSEPFAIMQDFEKNYNAERISLGKNHRSTNLLTYAGRYYLAESFKGKLPTPEEPDLSGDEKIEIVKCFDDVEEGNFVFDFIRGYEGDRSSICIMARANRYLTNLYRKLERKNLALPPENRIPFFTADSDLQFYKKPVIKDFLSFLRLLVNPFDGSAFERIALKYVKGIGKETVSAISDFGVYGLSLSTFLMPQTYAFSDPYSSLISAYKSINAVIYDTETTGLDVENDQIIQISALKIGTGETFNRFIIPTCEIAPKALKTHGYDLEHIKSNGGAPASEVLKDFVNFVGDGVLIGHNSSSFDDNILNARLKAEGLDLSKNERYDTLLLAQAVLPNLGSYTLENCAKNFGIVNERAHDAFADVETTAKLFKKLMDDFYIPQTDARKRIVTQKKAKFQDFYEQFNQMQAMLDQGKMLELIKFINDNYGLLKVNSRNSDRESANDLFRALKQIEFAPDKRRSLRAFLSDASLSGSQMDLIVKKHGKIPLITVHQSKGCEFDTVILVGADENELPSYGARQSGDEEEEKRIFYVAISRAKKKFIITYPANKVYGQNVYPKNPSPYVNRLPKSVVKTVIPYAPKDE